MAGPADGHAFPFAGLAAAPTRSTPAREANFLAPAGSRHGQLRQSITARGRRRRVKEAPLAEVEKARPLRSAKRAMEERGPGKRWFASLASRLALRLPAYAPYAPLVAITLTALCTSAHVGCAGGRDDDTLSEDALYGYGYGYVPEVAASAEPPPCGPLPFLAPPAFRPPTTAHQRACSREQLDALVPCLLSGTCPAIATADEACVACLMPGDGATGGVLTRTRADEPVRYSRGACAALMMNDLTSASCGAKVETLEACAAESCRACAGSEKSRCVRDAARGVCEPYTAEGACFRGLDPRVQRTCRDPLTAASFVCGM